MKTILATIAALTILTATAAAECTVLPCVVSTTTLSASEPDCPAGTYKSMTTGWCVRQVSRSYSYSYSYRYPTDECAGHPIPSLCRLGR